MLRKKNNNNNNNAATSLPPLGSYFPHTAVVSQLEDLHTSSGVGNLSVGRNTTSSGKLWDLFCCLWPRRSVGRIERQREDAASGWLGLGLEAGFALLWAWLGVSVMALGVLSVRCFISLPLACVMSTCV